jgi:hypothetical protein
MTTLQFLIGLIIMIFFIEFEILIPYGLTDWIKDKIHNCIIFLYLIIMFDKTIRHSSLKIWLI